MHDELLYFDKGVYTVPEAARLTGIDARSISRWVRGYYYPRGGAHRRSPPVFEADFEPFEGRYALSFLDLMELRFVRAFRQYDLSFYKIRLASIRASVILNTHHPFASRRFFTDRKTIFLRIAEEEGDPELLDIVKGQYGIDKVLSPLLLEGVEYGDEHPTRWYPMGKQRGILIDPRHSFGQPIVARYWVRTSVLYTAFKAEGSIEKAAKWYEVDESAVRRAIDFETKLAS